MKNVTNAQNIELFTSKSQLKKQACCLTENMKLHQHWIHEFIPRIRPDKFIYATSRFSSQHYSPFTWLYPPRCYCTREIARMGITVTSSLKWDIHGSVGWKGCWFEGGRRYSACPSPFYSRLLDRYLKATWTISPPPRIIASFLHVMPTLGISETVFKEKKWFMGPYAGVGYNSP